MWSRRWWQILAVFFKIIENPGSFLKLLRYDSNVLSLNWCVSSHIIDHSSKIIQYRIKLKLDSLIWSFLLKCLRILPSKSDVHSIISKSEFVAQEIQPDKVVDQNFVVFLEENWIICIC